MENLTQSANITELIKAMLEVQAEIKPIKKDAWNPYYESKYTSLESVVEYSKPILSGHNLIIIQTMHGTCGVTTTLAHISGQWIRGTLELTPAKNNPQGAGSAITYARRYSWASIIGLVPDEDDDGNEASKKEDKPAKFQPMTKPQQEQSKRLFNYLVAHYDSEEMAKNGILEDCGVKASNQISTTKFAEVWKRYELKVKEFEDSTGGQ